MSVMERRLQLLLDQERYARVQAEARRSGSSVSSVIRGAIDIAYPSDLSVRIDALKGLVEIADHPEEPPEEPWEAIKESFDGDPVSSQP